MAFLLVRETYNAYKIAFLDVHRTALVEYERPVQYKHVKYGIQRGILNEALINSLICVF